MKFTNHVSHEIKSLFLISEGKSRSNYGSYEIYKLNFMENKIVISHFTGGNGQITGHGKTLYHPHKGTAENTIHAFS